jgi:hypothetical protein
MPWMEPIHSSCIPTGTFFAMISYHGCQCSIVVTQSCVFLKHALRPTHEPSF